LTAKRWRLVVTDLGGAAAPSEVTAEGENWMKALTHGRALLGEPAALPGGASCVPGPQGKFTVLDPGGRRRYDLVPMAEAPTATPQAPSPAPRPAAPGPAAPKKRAKHTVAYMPGPPEPAAPAPGKKKLAARTMAYMPSPLAPPAGAPPPREVVVGAPPAPAAPAPPAARAAPQPAPAPAAQPPPPAAAPEPSKPAAPQVRMLRSHDEDPSADNPLRYRERIVLVPEGTSRRQAEAVVRAVFDKLRRELEPAPPGKFLNLSVFDHPWEQEPLRPPLVTLQWKDWRGDPQVTFPESAPPKAAAHAPAPPRPQPAADDDPRLAHAFDACQDLPFLASTTEAMDFVVRLLGELVACDAVTGMITTSGGDLLQVAAATGSGSEAMQGQSLPAREGLCAAAAASPRGILRVDDATADGRFVAAREGRPGLGVRSVLYATMTRGAGPVGMLQLLNRHEGGGFTESDAEVAAYVAGAAAEVIGR
jgi:hypothetical protein